MSPLHQSHKQRNCLHTAALVGASLACGQMDTLETWLRDLGIRDIIKLIDKIADTLAPIRERMETMLPTDNGTDRTRGMFETMNASIDIMQDRITKSRLAGDPPDILISPHLAHMGWLEFDRAEEAIKAGKQAVKRALSAGAFHALLSARNLDCESYEPD